MELVVEGKRGNEGRDRAIIPSNHLEILVSYD